MTTTRYFNSKVEKATYGAENEKKESQSKLSPEMSAVYEEAIKIISQYSPYISSTTKNQLSTLLRHQTTYSCNLFLNGLEMTETQLRTVFISKWSQLLKNLHDHLPKLAQRVHDYFLKNYSWNDLNSHAFFNLMDRLIKLKTTPEKKIIRSWFNKYFQHTAVHIQKSALEKAILKFNQFCDLCDKHNIHSHLAKPPKKLISFQVAGDDYIENCNYALNKSAETKSFEQAIHSQAEVLNQLPSMGLIKQVFAQGYALVCDKMLFLNKILSIPKREVLESAVSFSNFRAQALVFLSASKHLSITKPLLFFKSLEQVSEKILHTSEKLIIAKAFVTFYQVDEQIDLKREFRISPTPSCQLKACSHDGVGLIRNSRFKDFLACAIEFKKTFGASYLEKLGEKLDDQTAEDYLTACQFLTELKDNFDIDVLFKKHLPNIKNLNRELETIKIELSKKQFPEEKLEDVLNKFKTKNELVQFLLADAEVKQLADDYQTIVEHNKILQKLPLSELSLAARKAGQELKHDRSNRNATLELVGIIRETINRVFFINPYNTQILALLALICVPQGKKGRIAQVKTGEGKSLIDAMLAAYLGCQDKFVDIITSSSNLAIRDQKKYAKFFSIFGITTSHICHVHPEKEHFDGQILYGTNTDFEFSILRDELYHYEHRYTVLNGQRVKRLCDVAIVDEVDNLFLDMALNSARISSPSSESKAWVYAPILAYIKQNDRTLNVNEHILPVKKYLQEAYDGKYAEEVTKIPDPKIKDWLRSALRAWHEKKLNRDYVLIPRKKQNGDEDREKLQVVIVDYQNTGRLCEGMRWHHGLHEFIEVKEGLEPTAESLTSASISHPAFFNSFNEIYGLSGTVGEEVERQEIEAIYNISTFDVPPHARNQRYILTPLLLATEEQYFTAILGDIQNVLEEMRPSLVIFDSIEQANKFSQYLSTKKIRHQVLDDKQKEDEDYLISRAGRPGMVTIATNTAGRGTDILLTLESAIAGGLHVILAFYPANVRVELQGLGRAGRQGQPGTCRIILQNNDEQIAALVPEVLIPLLIKDADNFIHQLQKLRTVRVTNESKNRLARIKIDTIQHNVLKQFCLLLNYARKALATLDFANLITELKLLKELHSGQESSNLEVRVLQKQLFNHISQQANGIHVDWKSFLNTAKEVFFNFVLSKWAVFYDKLSDGKARLTAELYQIATFKHFHEFISQNLMMLKNPQLGFYHWFNELTANALNLPSLTPDAFYTEWENKLKQYSGAGQYQIKIFDRLINFYEPQFQGDNVHYELKQIHQPITKIIDVDQKNEEENSLLAKFIEQGDLNSIKQLLQETKIDIKTAKINDDPPLIAAAKKGHLELVQWLLRTKQATLKDTSPNGSTALLWTADRGHLPIVQWLLLEGGAEATEKTVGGNTVLLCAAYNCHLHVMQWLVENGYSSIHEKNNRGAMALHYCAVDGSVTCMQWLLKEGFPIDECNSVGNTALTLSAINHHLPAVKLLLKHKATLVTDKDGDTALHRAAMVGDQTIIEWLLQETKGTVVDKNNNGDTPLILAAVNGHLPLVKWLLKNGSAVNERNVSQLTPLIVAASNGHLSVVQWLLKHGGSIVNEKDESGSSALFHAVIINHPMVVKFLLENGADINEKNNYGKRVAKYAKTDEMRLLLQEYNEKLKSSKPKVSLAKISRWKPAIPIAQERRKKMEEQKLSVTSNFAS